MKNLTRLLIASTAISVLAFMTVGILNDDIKLVLSVFTCSMVLLPFTVYRVLLDGYEKQRRLVAIEAQS